MPAVAFLIIHTIAYGGSVQTLSAFRYPSMFACEQFKSELKIENTEPSTQVAMVFCTDRQPEWWR